MSSKIEYLEWETPSQPIDWEGIGSYVVWKSTCGRYRVARIDGVSPGSSPLLE